MPKGSVMPNNECVLRSELIEHFQNYNPNWGVIDKYAVLDDIRDFPSADVEPVRYGRWKKSYADHEAFGVRPFFRYCSECHEATVHQYNYCPNCGAKMLSEPPKEE